MYPYAGHEWFPFNPNSLQNYDLNFASTKIPYETQATGRNLYNLYWSNFWNGIHSTKARKLNAKVMFDELDMNKIRFNDVIFYDDFFRA